MDNKSETIFFSLSEIKVLAAQNMLREAGIESYVINKKDSAYAGLFGDIELHVNKDDAEKARELLTAAEIL